MQHTRMGQSWRTREAGLGRGNRRPGKDSILSLVDLGSRAADAALRIHASGKREDGTERKRRGFRHGERRISAGIR